MNSSWNNPDPEPEAIVSAVLNGYNVCEVPVEMRERKEGVSSINWVRSIYYMVKVPLALILQRIITRRNAKWIEYFK